ncbi:galectin-1-like [Pyxicephalus adspersus]
MDGEGVIVNNLAVKPGQSVEVKGLIAEECTDFAINLGKDPENLLLHFNPRFDLSGVTNIIFCNSRENNDWGEEQKEDVFPFQKGSDTTVSFKYEKEKIIILLPSGSWFSFPVRLPMEVISYLSLKNLQLKCLKIE